MHAALIWLATTFFFLAFLRRISPSLTFCEVGGVLWWLYRKKSPKKAFFCRYFSLMHIGSLVVDCWARAKMQRSQNSQKSTFFEKSWFLTFFCDFWLFLGNCWLMTYDLPDKSYLPSKIIGGQRSVVLA